MPTFLLKTEPSSYSFDDLLRDKATTWDGITNPQANNFLRTARAGDAALIYHTGDEKAVVGLAEFTADAHPDPEGQTKLIVAALKPVKRAKTPVTLAAIKADPRFKDFLLVRNSRLSVMPVPPALDKALRKLAGL